MINTDIKKLSYSPYDDSVKRAKKDKVKAKNYPSPDVGSKRFKTFVPSQNLWIYSDNKRVFDHMKEILIIPELTISERISKNIRS